MEDGIVGSIRPLFITDCSKQLQETHRGCAHFLLPTLSHPWFILHPLPFDLWSRKLVSTDCVAQVPVPPVPVELL